MKTVFFTIVSDDYYYAIGCPKMINSFRKFHPDIDLVVFRDDVIDRVFKENGINFYNAKPTFAKLLTDKYDLVVNIDADTVITAPLDGVVKGDYDVGAVWNYNSFENASFENITEKMYLQAGLIGATDKTFWDKWEDANIDAMKYPRKENDIMNKVIYSNDYKLKIFDKDYGYMGCKSLGLEEEFYVEGNKLMCNKEQVFAYHHAKGGQLPKLDYDKMPFTWEVKDFLRNVSHRGRSSKITNAI